MKIIINGTQEDVADQCTIADYCASKKIDPARVAVEINRDIIPREAFGQRTFSPDDVVEIIRFVGGG